MNLDGDIKLKAFSLSQEILAPYIEGGQVTLIDWPIPQGQMAAFADCAEKFGNVTRNAYLCKQKVI